MRRTLLLAAGALLACAPSARAVFVKSQMDRVDPEPLFDAEYFSDLQTFSYPLAWEDQWAGSTTAYRINGASLDCCSLLLQQELKFERHLIPGLDFRFRLVQDEDKDKQEFHTWLELEKSLAWGFSGILFGEPTFKKEDSDIGLGLGWRGGPWRLAWRRDIVDFNFNKRGSTTQRYSRYPVTDDFRAEVLLGEHRWDLRVEVDHPLRREVPDENRLYSYRRTTAKASWRRASSGRTRELVEYAYEFFKEGNLFNPDAANASVSFRRQTHQVRAAVVKDLRPGDELEAGHGLMIRAARSDREHAPADGVFYRRWEAQPYARWRHAFGAWGVSELAPFLALGENRERRSDPAEVSANRVVAEAKLGAGFDFLFGSSGRIGLYGTFDLDELGSHAWDGGSARASFLF